MKSRISSPHPPPTSLHPPRQSSPRSPSWAIGTSFRQSFLFIPPAILAKQSQNPLHISRHLRFSRLNYHQWPLPRPLFPQQDGTIVMRGNDIEIKILKIENNKITLTVPSAAWQVPLGGHRGLNPLPTPDLVAEICVGKK